MNAPRIIHLVLATRNAHKTREFSEILGPDFHVSDLRLAREFPAVEETGSTFEENAALKAVAASRAMAGLVAADDSGLAVDALGGAPGVRSARYAGDRATEMENVDRLLREMRDAEKRMARFCCVIVVARNGEILATFRGLVAGTIAASPRGTEGFGYDPVFIPEGFIETFAQLGKQTKNQLSHRAAAIAQLRDYLRNATQQS